MYNIMPGSLFDHQMGGVPALIDLIGLITSTDFNYPTDLKLMIIDSESQPILSPTIYVTPKQGST